MGATLHINALLLANIHPKATMRQCEQNSGTLDAVSWTLWGILLLVLLWAFVDSVANPVYSPEVSTQVGPMVMGALLIVFVGFGLLLRWPARRRSTGCLIALTLMLPTWSSC